MNWMRQNLMLTKISKKYLTKHDLCAILTIDFRWCIPIRYFDATLASGGEGRAMSTETWCRPFFMEEI